MTLGSRFHQKGKLGKRAFCFIEQVVMVFPHWMRGGCRLGISIIIVSALVLTLHCMVVNLNKFQGHSVKRRHQFLSNPIATFNTSLGLFTVEIFLKQMPLTASNFIDLASSGFYDGTHFHGVIPGVMNKGGCPYTKSLLAPRLWGTGNPAPNSRFPYAYQNMFFRNKAGMERRDVHGAIHDEHSWIRNGAGALYLANAGRPHTGGSQFSINTHSQDDHKQPNEEQKFHAVFGKIKTGWGIVLEMNHVNTTVEHAPVVPIMLHSVSIQCCELQ